MTLRRSAGIVSTIGGVAAARRTVTYTAVGVAVVAWLLTGVAIIRVDELGVCERLGHLAPEPLAPGIHWNLPHPFGRTRCLPVKRIATMPVGFSFPDHRLAEQSLLWTKPHGGEEYPIIVGTGAEVVVVNALVRFKIDEHAEPLRQYVSATRNPEAALRSLAHRVLTDETRAATLDEVLCADRSGLAKRIEGRLRIAVAEHRLGLDVLDCGIISIHPPVAVAPAYLDIISARIDAEKAVTAAAGFSKAELLRCEMMAATFVADARAASSQRLASTSDESRRFTALAVVDKSSGAVARQQLQCETLGEALRDKRLVLIDKRLPQGLQLLLDDPKAGDQLRRARAAE